ncbi:MAG: ABC transporter ATP-binding protein [Cyanobacteria bacterium J06649_11]
MSFSTVPESMALTSELRKDEIYSYVAANDLNDATKRLMDFVSDFSSNRRRRLEVTGLRRDYSALREEIRKFGETNDTRREFRQLSERILDFLEDIFEETSSELRHFSSPPSTDSSDELAVPSSKSSLHSRFVGNAAELENRRHQPSNRATPSSPLTKLDEGNASLKAEPPNLDKSVVHFPKSKLPKKVLRANELKADQVKKVPIQRTQFAVQSQRDIPVAVNNVVFRGRGISKEYKSRNRSIGFRLHPVDLDLRLGEITAVVGENGNGKSTLLKIISGMLSESSGNTLYPCLKSPIRNDFYSIRQQISYISQDLPRWHGLLMDNLHFSGAIHGLTGKKNIEEVDFVVTRLGLESYQEALWNEISGGYKTRFALAKALLSKPKLLVLDEPLSNLDINTQLTFLQDLRSLANSASNPISVIVSSQHLHEVESIADNIIFLQDGISLYNGKISDLGVDRTENVYEVRCDLRKDQLLDILEAIEYTKVDTAGQHYIIYTSIQVSRSQILKLFSSSDISLKYFHDISCSTRKFFNA